MVIYILYGDVMAPHLYLGGLSMMYIRTGCKYLTCITNGPGCMLDTKPQTLSLFMFHFVVWHSQYLLVLWIFFFSVYVFFHIWVYLIIDIYMYL